MGYLLEQSKPQIAPARLVTPYACRMATHDSTDGYYIVSVCYSSVRRVAWCDKLSSESGECNQSLALGMALHNVARGQGREGLVGLGHRTIAGLGTSQILGTSRNNSKYTNSHQS